LNYLCNPFQSKRRRENEEGKINEKTFGNDKINTYLCHPEKEERVRGEGEMKIEIPTWRQVK